MEVNSPFYLVFFVCQNKRLLAERISKHSAKGNTAGSKFCGITGKSTIKSVKNCAVQQMIPAFASLSFIVYKEREAEQMPRMEDK